MPRFTQTDQTGRAGVHLVARLCSQMGVIWRETSASDTGFDGEIELTRGDHATAQIIKVQVKAGRSYRRRETEDRFVFLADADHFRYWTGATNPAILVVCDPEADRAWWKDLKTYAALHPDLLQTGRKQVRITFDKQCDRLTADSAEALRQVCAPTLESLLRPPADPAPPGQELDLLKARHRVTRLVGRDSDLADLWKWLTSREPVSARLLVGGAGAGKTRLAIELLRRAQAKRKNWRAGFLTPEGRDRLRADASRRRAGSAAPLDWVWHVPTLLVVDYAQTLARPLAALFRTLFRQCRAGRPPLRLLLLERVAGDWFEDLLRTEDSDGPGPVRLLFHPPRPVELTPIPPGPLRRQLLADTLAQAARLGRTPPPALPPETDAAFSESLHRADFANPLNLMLAALAAPESGLTAALRRERVDLAVDLARKELRRLARFAPVADDPAPQRILEHLAGCATLEHGFTVAELRQAIEEELPALGLAWPGGTGDLEAVLKQALPGEFLPVAPVEPDFIGEALVLTALARPDCPAGPDRWTSWCATMQRCARRDPRATPATVLHAFQNYGSHPEYGEALLAATDRLIETGLNDRDPTLLMGIEEALPESTLTLRARAAEVTRRLYQRFKRAYAAGRKELKPEVARLANNLAKCLFELGQSQQALVLAQEALQFYRVLAREKPGAFQPDLAKILYNLAGIWGVQGQRKKARTCAQEAIKHFRALADENPQCFLPDLAKALGNLALQVGSLGLHKQAIKLARESVELFQGLVTQNHNYNTAHLAHALIIMSTCLLMAGCKEEALKKAVEAEELFRTLAKENPDAFQPGLAKALDNKAICLGKLDLLEEAVATCSEALKIGRDLARENPTVLQSDLAVLLHNSAALLTALGHHKDALAQAREAVEIRRALARQNPNLFSPELARSLGTLGHVFEKLERPADALSCFHKGIRLLRSHFLALPAAHAPVMGALVTDYLRLTKALSQPKDESLLAPILARLKRRQRRSK